jgi:hypothetical protein
MRRIIIAGLATVMLMSTFAASALANGAQTLSAELARDPFVRAALARDARVVGGELVYPNGVMVSLAVGGQGSSQSTTAALIACSPGYTCLYEHDNFRGRRLQWSDPGTRVNLPDYGFNDQMSSWINNNSRDARWFYNHNSDGTSRCMQPNTRVTWVGEPDNDEASSLAIYTDNRAC